MAQLRARVRSALARCKEPGDCEGCAALDGEACGMADDYLRLLDADEAAIAEFARLYAEAKCDNIGHTSFRPGLARLKFRNRLSEKLREMGIRNG